MIVKGVDILNLDDLYLNIVNKSEDADNKYKHFGKDLAYLYNHTSILFHLMEVNAYEFIFLKMFASSVGGSFQETYLIDSVDRYIYKQFPEIYHETDLLRRFIENTMEPEANGRSSYGCEMMPLSSIIGNCTATFTGAQLTHLLGVDPERFFVDESKRKCLKEENNEIMFSKEYAEKIDSEFESILIKKLFESFYKFMVNKATSIDLVSDTYIHNLFKSVPDKGDISIKSIRSQYFLIDFTTVNLETLSHTMENYKKNILSNTGSKFKNKDIRLEIACNVDFYTFFCLYYKLSVDKFSCIDGFISAANESTNEEFIPEINSEWNDYKKRFNMRLSKMVNEISNCYGNKENLIKQLSCTMGYSSIRFIFLINYDDVKELSIYYKNKFDDYNKTRYYSHIHIIELIDKIDKFFQLILSSGDK